MTEKYLADSRELACLFSVFGIKRIYGFQNLNESIGKAECLAVLQKLAAKNAIRNNNGTLEVSDSVRKLVLTIGEAPQAVLLSSTKLSLPNIVVYPDREEKILVCAASARKKDGYSLYRTQTELFTQELTDEDYLSDITQTSQPLEEQTEKSLYPFIDEQLACFVADVKLSVTLRVRQLRQNADTNGFLVMNYGTGCYIIGKTNRAYFSSPYTDKSFTDLLDNLLRME